MKTRAVTFLSLVVCIASMCAGTVAAQEAKKTPPCTSPEYSQFDFWVGEWRVTDEGGEFQGNNRIEKVLGGCALEENWTGAQGMTGYSYNIYAKGRAIWHQTWVDSNGTLLLLEGGLEDGKMVLRGDGPGKDGGTINHEISWQPLDSGQVRQTWRVSSDGGNSWNNAFVGIYTREH